MIPLFTIKEGQRKVSQLARRLQDYEKQYPNLLVGTLDFYGYGNHIFSLTCKKNLLFSLRLEAIWSSMDGKWNFFYADSGKRLEKTLGWKINEFMKECKKRSLRY